MSNYGGRGVFGGNVPRISADDVRHQWQQKHVEKSQPKQQAPTGQKRRERAMNRDTGKRDSSGPLGSPGRRQRDEYIARGESTNSNFKVVIRVRPPLPRELNGDAPFQNIVAVDQSFRTITLSENPDDVDEEGYRYKYGPYSTHRFTFDHVYDQSASQENVYNNTAKGVVDSALQGYNATIFAYGQTGTGKTYTMEGFHEKQHDLRGIIPRSIEQIFSYISTSVSPRMRFLVRASYLQIYNENISDLLKPERSSLSIREDKTRGVFVEGLSEWVVRSPQEIYMLMQRGGTVRATGSTKMNEISSRSHAVFIIIAEQSETTYVDASGAELAPEKFHELVKNSKTQADLAALESNVRQSFKVGKLNLVDLAGSERVRLSGATGQRLEESKKINQSLSALGNVIAALTDSRGRQHIPYRDSKLTRILEDSLGGNCKTTMMAMVSPAMEAMSESISTLKFANRAKNIKNVAVINEDIDQRSLLRKYERELKKLRAELNNRSRNVVDKRRLLELDEQRRRAEQDKMAAIRALEKRSMEFMREKEQKKRLEARIYELEDQMLKPGKDVEDTPAFRVALKEQRDQIRGQYEKRLAELEQERETIEEEKAQVDRYKQLLLKQRDIMIALTQRLNERDEQIMALQDELDAYDRHQKKLEEKLDEKTAELIHLQRVTMEHNANSPIKNEELNEALGTWAPGQDGVILSSPGGAAAIRRKMAGRPAGSAPAGKAGAERGVSGGGKAAAGPQTPNKGGPGSSKKYAPYHDTVLFVGDNQGGNGEMRSMLNADEKIKELTRVLEVQKQEQKKLAQELEDVQAEKVSMEYLLREKLEKLVQSEIEARLNTQKQPVATLKNELDSVKKELKMALDARRLRDTEISDLRMKLGESNSAENSNITESLHARIQSLSQQYAQFRLDVSGQIEKQNDVIRQLEAENNELRKGNSAGAEQAQVRGLQDRMATYRKERKAIQTIMENKIKALADNIAVATQAVISDSHNFSDPSRSKQQISSSKQLSREVQALQRLVNAAITALKNAAE
jgi:kinesin family protein 3/17